MSDSGFVVISNNDIDDESTSENNTKKPASFRRLEDFARAVLAVPKKEADAIEQEEKRKQRKRTPADQKPAK